MYWSIFDDYTIRRYLPKGSNPILIRILEPYYLKKGEPYVIYTLDKYKDVLNLYFDDITKLTAKKTNNKFVLFSEKDCVKIIDFVKRNRFDEIVVHCGAGISRSSAIMICISRLLNLPQIEEEIYKSNRFNPNTHILNIYDNLKTSQINIYEKSILYNSNKDIWDNEDLDIILKLKNE